MMKTRISKIFLMYVSYAFLTVKFFSSVILRQIVRILYADHVKAEIINGDTSTIENKWSFENTVELIDEPPVSELVG